MRSPPRLKPRAKPKPAPKPAPRPVQAPRPRAETAAETREALIAAGLRLFGEHGLDAPSLDAICAHAGKTRGAFYVHFADRDAFLEAVMERAGAAYLDAVIGDGDSAPDLGAIVRRFVASIASGEYPLTRAGGPRPHQLLEACARSPAVRARYVAIIQRVLERLAAALAAGQSEGGASGLRLRGDLDPQHGAAMLLSIVLGAQTMLELGLPLDVPRTAQQVMALIVEPAPAPKPARRHSAKGT